MKKLIVLDSWEESEFSEKLVCCLSTLKFAEGILSTSVEKLKIIKSSDSPNVKKNSQKVKSISEVEREVIAVNWKRCQ